MSVHDELKKAVNRIAALEQELKISEDVREQRRDELAVLSEKYEAEKYKAEARSRTIETLQNKLRQVESAYSSDSELWESTKYDMEATIHELRTRLRIDPGGGDVIDAQESTIEHLRSEAELLTRQHEADGENAINLVDQIDVQHSALDNLGHVLGRINEGLKTINVRIAFIGHPHEPFWMPPSNELKGGETSIPDWRKEIALIHEMLLWTDHAGESRDCPSCHQRRHDCICVDSAL